MTTMTMPTKKMTRTDTTGAATPVDGEQTAPTRAATTAALLLLILMVTVTAVAGCSDSSAKNDAGSDGVAAVNCGSPDPGTGAIDYLDDMEDGDAQILARVGRRAQWYTYNDGTVGALQAPAPMTAPPMESIPGARCTYSTRAMRVTGSGFTDWGAGSGFDLLVDTTAGVWNRMAYDAAATGAKGITFWARVGEPSLTRLRLNVLDKWTDPDGGVCDMSVTTGATACYDAFGAYVELTTTWKRVVLTWGQMGQRHFGLTRPSLDTANLFAIHFDVDLGPVFDYWIDDVAFFQ